MGINSESFIFANPRVKAVIAFIGVIGFFYLVWPLTVTDEYDVNDRHYIMLWGTCDITAFYLPIIENMARQIHFVVTKIFRIEAAVGGDLILGLSAPMGLQVVWGCCGLKQSLEFLFSVLLCPGGGRKKLWYIPLGLLILHCFNVLRLAVVFYFTGYGPETGELVHYAFKWLYNGCIFLLWLVWAEFLYARPLLRSGGRRP